MKKSLQIVSIILTLIVTMASVWADDSDNTSEGNATQSEQITAEPTIQPKVRGDKIEFSDDIKKIDVDGWRIRYQIKNGETTVYTLSEESTSTSNKLVIPGYIYGYPVRTIGTYILHDVQGVEEVELPDTVYTIDEYAFAGGMVRNEVDGEWDGIGIKKIRLSENLREIGNSAFENTRLEEITFPATLKKIGDEAFKNTLLKEVYIPDTVEKLGERAFQGCRKLVKVNLPARFKNVKGVFSGCLNIEDVDFDGELTENMLLMFKDSRFLENYAKDNESGLLIRDDILLVYGGTEKNVVIPEGVTRIQEAAFKDADIESITFPSTLRYIDEEAFCNTSLKELYIPANVKVIGTRAFSNIKTLTKLTIEDKSQYPQLNVGAFENCSNLTEVILPKRLNISKEVFDGTPYEWRVEEKAMGAVEIRDADNPIIMPTPDPSTLPLMEVINKNGDIEIRVGGYPVYFPEVQPFIDENDRTQVPLRAISEEFGYSVEYNDGEIMIEGPDLKVTLRIGEKEIKIKSSKYSGITEMDTVARIVDDRTYVPARYVGEMLGFSVEYVD